MGSDEFRTLSELFLKATEEHPKPDAFLFKSAGKYRSLSSGEALRQVAVLAAALERLGLARGERLAIVAENRVEWALTDYAALALGAVDVPLYPTLLEPDIEYMLRDSEAKGVVVSTETQLKKVLNTRSRLPELKFVLCMDRVASVGTGVQSWHGVLSDELHRLADPVEFLRQKAQEVRPEDTASILYTSGTSGEPKGVILTHANFVSNVQACQPLFPLGPDDVGMSFLPLCHVFERMLDYFYFAAGASVAYAESLGTLAQNFLEVRPTIMGIVPRVLEKIQGRVLEAIRQTPWPKRKLFSWALAVGRRCFPYRLENRTAPIGLRLQHVLADRLVCSKVRARLGGRAKYVISGAAPLRRELAEFFLAVGLPLFEGYGLTETSPVVAVNYPGNIKLGTVGRPIPGVEVRLAEEAAEYEAGTGSEILVRGPNVTPGYYHRDEANREAFVAGWFCTGDLGALDSDGYLSVTGRKKNLFKTSAGKYVSPDKLENLFQGHPYVAQIVVFGAGRRFPSALIVPNFASLEICARQRGLHFATREELTAKPEIRAFMERQIQEATRWLAPHEKIRQFVLLPTEFSIESGELTPTQKVKRRVVEEHYHDLIEEMYRRAGSQLKATLTTPRS